MATKELLYEKEGNLAIITFNRPEKLNAFSDEMSDALVDAVEDAGRDAKVKALILTGAGDRAFTAGADVGGMSTRLQEGRRGHYTVKEWIERGMGQKHPAVPLYNIEKPTFAAINGIAVGLGLGILLACDFRIASEKARFGASFVLRGLVNDYGVSWHLPRVVGVSKALELMLTGDIIDAKEALHIGLVGKVVPSEKLMEATREMAGKIAKGPSVAQALIKREVRRSVRTDSLEMQMDFEHGLQNWASQTEDHQEGVRAFLEKREPHYKGQ